MNNHLKQELAKIEIPMELHERSKLGVKKAKSEMESKIKVSVRKRFVSAILAASLIIPTGAFAYQTLLVDELYGSFDNLKKQLSSATMQGYLRLNAKLTQAKGGMEKKEYEQYKELLKMVSTSKVKYGNEYGNIDYSQVPSEQLDEMKRAMFELQPYFDQLNGLKSSKEVLTSEEYENYIDALMTYETIMAQSGNDLENIPSHLQDEFTKVRDIIRYVDEKQRQ
ncbi:anti-sigma factor [Paenibacillus sp. FSL H7-0326]|uniref:DUF3600 domain-containing protein n=1 Tax=Paenibacillus sp. FSL H7-0326 TaxID=1921144 RepID=UPI00096F16B1|nr:DUF3600 domain-containing protein [Paenibacillus sp. FSL H7-0326]OMC66185.1 anti-sigma factor [Paenibacillus sp. FSL H7-0326]